MPVYLFFKINKESLLSPSIEECRAHLVKVALSHLYIWVYFEKSGAHLTPRDQRRLKAGENAIETEGFVFFFFFLKVKV